MLQQKEKQLYFIKVLNKLLIYNTDDDNDNTNSDDNIVIRINKFIQDKTGLSEKQYWLSSGNKKIQKDYRLTHYDTIEVNLRLKGGFGFSLSDIIDAVRDAVLSAIDAILSPIKDPIWDIIKMLLKLVKLLTLIVKGLIWLFMFIIWFFTEFLNPYNLVTDFLGSMSRLIRVIMIMMGDVIFGLFRAGLNLFGESVFTGLFGWDDQSKEKYFKRKNGKNGNGKNDNGHNDDGDNDDDCEDSNCYHTDYRNIPFSVIISTILMPPLGILMEFGIKYWINIIICGMLTLMFYFPGLIYALILIYC